ncbi:MAG TPA: hypothetical protein IAA55_05300 [Candidatus Pullilachnospira gallistercoris]|uniref:Uncharacterized protein n=1 Tax=Candidatus Pullilachnospira gallistercoris TaxID=2840911 RepID=A0A9D1E9M5_9FIRM|nr:hypothetical protein [Candidatus Pullilachnospira gallistercoris]
MAKAKAAKAQMPVMSAKKKGWGYDLKKNWPPVRDLPDPLRVFCDLQVHPHGGNHDGV